LTDEVFSVALIERGLPEEVVPAALPLNAANGLLEGLFSAGFAPNRVGALLDMGG